MIVHEELGEQTPRVALIKKNHPIQAFLLDGAHKSLRVRIAVGCAKRCLDHARTGRLQQLPNGGGPLPISVADHEPGPSSTPSAALVR
jgi:hypothetical protein